MENNDFKISNKKKDLEKSNAIRKMWEVMAQRPSEFDMQVIDALKATIIGNANNEEQYGCYGEQIYLTIREQLINFKTNDNKIINFLINDKGIAKEEQTKDKSSGSGSGNEKSDKTIKKADLIRIESTMKKLKERLTTILNSLNLVNFTIPAESVVFSDILEMRAIGFIYISWFIYNNKDKYTEKLIPFSVIVSLQRFISIINNYEGYNATNPGENIPISKTLVAL